METLNHQIAAAVKAAIQSEGSSRSKVLVATGMAGTTFDRSINGGRPFTGIELIAIANHLGISASQFLPGVHAGALAAPDAAA